MEIGRLLGKIGIYLVLSQLLLIAWGRRTEIHKLNGKLAYLAVLAHGVIMLYSYGIALLKISDFFKAFLALILLTIVAFTSVFISRLKLKYETWYAVHLLTYLVIILAFAHQTKSPLLYFFYIFVFGNLIYFRILKQLINFAKYRFKIIKLVRETSRTISVYIGGQNLDQFVFKPGQFVIVRFLIKNLWWEAHPFSLSSIPNGQTLRLTIKNIGDFTYLLNTCPIILNTSVLIDGPYGEFTAERSKLNKILLLAGGVGITPLRGLIEEFTSIGKDAILVYANKTKADVIFQKELSKFKVKYVFSNQNQHLDKNLLKKLVPDASSREAYVCGPQRFNSAMEKYLQELGVELIHLEKFSLH